MEKTALLLEITGFFITGMLVAVIQWEKVKPLSDRAKLFIIEFPTRLKISYSKIAWVVSNPIRTHNSHVPLELRIWQAPIWMVKTIIYTLLIAPVLLIILSLLLIFLYSVRPNKQKVIWAYGYYKYASWGRSFKNFCWFDFRIGIGLVILTPFPSDISSPFIM